MRGTFCIKTFFARGYSRELREVYRDDNEELRRVQLDVELVTSVCGPEPGNFLCFTVTFVLAAIGYVATPKLVVQAAYTLLWERDRVPHEVLTPAAAFLRTSLIERLNEQGIVFSITVKK